MAVPNTYLYTAPIKLANAVGREILSGDIIKGLRRINANLCTPLPEHYEHYYPLQRAGITCLWLGRPGVGNKITAFRLGPVPEFTQLDRAGNLLCKGWRAIFYKVIRSRAATKKQVEAQFAVDLSVVGVDKSCTQCRRQGVVKLSVGANHLCWDCNDTYETTQAVGKFQDEWIGTCKDIASRPKGKIWLT